MPVSTRQPSGAGRVSEERGIEGYYRLHARIYDATRWSFLFGRDAIIERAAMVQQAPGRILEVGCGTGRNLAALARRFPRAEITGVDLSQAMLAVAQRRIAPWAGRITLRAQSYERPLRESGYDLVLCSYALSMFNPGYATAIASAHGDLVPGGCFALVDFHGTRHPWFARWMRFNHVRMERHLRPALRDWFEPVLEERPRAYGGWWEYLLFVGRKR